MSSVCDHESSIAWWRWPGEQASLLRGAEQQGKAGQVGEAERGAADGASGSGLLRSIY